MIPIPLPHHYSDRSFFVPEGTFEATSQSEYGGVWTPASRNFFLPWSSNGVSFEETPMCDLPIRDLMSGGLADFWPFLKGYGYEEHVERKTDPLLPPLGVGGVLLHSLMLSSSGRLLITLRLGFLRGRVTSSQRDRPAWRESVVEVREVRDSDLVGFLYQLYGGRVSHGQVSQFSAGPA